MFRPLFCGLNYLKSILKVNGLFTLFELNLNVDVVFYIFKFQKADIKTRDEENTKRKYLFVCCNPDNF